MKSAREIYGQFGMPSDWHDIGDTIVRNGQVWMLKRIVASKDVARREKERLEQKVTAVMIAQITDRRFELWISGYGLGANLHAPRNEDLYRKII